MERFVTVNDFPGSTAANRPFNPHPVRDFGADFGPAAANDDGQTAASITPIAKRSDQGPCLYLGPKGQRCSNPAIADGFCAKHRPGEAKATSGAASRLAAGIGILAAMWPVLADVIREVIRWIHSH
jgi:hypothetical protein